MSSAGVKETEVYMRCLQYLKWHAVFTPVMEEIPAQESLHRNYDEIRMCLFHFLRTC